MIQSLQNFGSRKFLLAVALTGTGCAGFIIGRMDGASFVAFSTLILAAYGGVSIADKKLNTGAPA